MSIGQNLYNITLKVPGTQPLAMLFCGFFWRSYRKDYCLLLVFVMWALARLYPCMYVYLPKF